MAAALEFTPVSYEDLAEIEREFDDVETETIRTQEQLMAPLYEKRQKTLSQIPEFWPLVIEQAPPDIDQYIQPSDSALILTSLKSLSVSRFEIGSTSKPSEPPAGDPRSISIRFEFNENEYFEDTVLEKKFWWRKAKDGWAGLVSEPVPIKWKQGKDLTGGLLDMVFKAWELEKKQALESDGPSEQLKTELSKQQKALKKKIDSTGMGGLSFFAWFGFIGRKISAEESRQAGIKEEERRKARKDAKNGKAVVVETAAESEDEDDENEDLGMELEIFDNGDDLATSISQDLWPDAIKYFTQAQEQDALSDADFESDDDLDEQFSKQVGESPSDEEMDEDEEGRPPAKKRRN